MSNSVSLISLVTWLCPPGFGLLGREEQQLAEETARQFRAEPTSPIARLLSFKIEELDMPGTMSLGPLALWGAGMRQAAQRSLPTGVSRRSPMLR